MQLEAAIDNQSVKGTLVPGLRGCDANTKVKGRKRHILIDTMGLVMKARATQVDVQDRDGARRLLKNYPTHTNVCERFG